MTGVNDLVVSGNLIVDGTSFIVYQDEVRTSDNLIVVNYGEVGPGVTEGFAGMDVDRGTLTDYRFAFYEDTDTFRVGEIGDTQAVATREDNPVDLRVPWWSDIDKRFDTQGTSYVQIDTTNTEIKIVIDSADQLVADANGITLASGTNVNEFSTDGTLGGVGASDNVVPTEKAVKTYVDAGDAATLSSANAYTDAAVAGLDHSKIYDANSSIHVIDSTAAGRADITIDDSLVGRWTASGLTMASGATVNEFSTDGTLGGNSDTALPTEKAVKTYVDNQITNLEDRLDLVNVVHISSDSTAATGDVVLVDTTGGDVTVTLHGSTDAHITVKKITTDSNTVTIVPDAGTIDGHAQRILDYKNQSYVIVCDGTDYFIV